MIDMIHIAVSISETGLLARISSTSSNIIRPSDSFVLTTGQIVPISFHNDLNNLLSMSSSVHKLDNFVSRVHMNKPLIHSTTSPTELLSPSKSVNNLNNWNQAEEIELDALVIKTPSLFSVYKDLKVLNRATEPVLNRATESVLSRTPEPVLSRTPEPALGQASEPVLKSNLKTSPNLTPKKITYNEEVIVHDVEIEDGNTIKKVDYSKQNSIPLGRTHKSIPPNFPLYKYRVVKTDDIREYINYIWGKNGYT
jgi:hypothetical protein